MADKLAILSNSKSLDEVAIAILEVVREDLFEGILRKKAWEEALKNAKIDRMTSEEARKIKIAPIRHPSLNPDLLIRIRLVRAAIFDVYPHSFEFWLSGFQRDMHPEDEVKIWEKMAACYLESVAYLEIADISKKEEVFHVVLGLFHFNELQNITKEYLTDNERQSIFNFFRHPIPYFDLEDDFFGDNNENLS